MSESEGVAIDAGTVFDRREIPEYADGRRYACMLWLCMKACEGRGSKPATGLLPSTAGHCSTSA